MSLNGLSTASARPAPQPWCAVLTVQGKQNCSCLLHCHTFPASQSQRNVVFTARWNIHLSVAVQYQLGNTVVSLPNNKIIGWYQIITLILYCTKLTTLNLKWDQPAHQIALYRFFNRRESDLCSCEATKAVAKKVQENIRGFNGI